jgi:hypothetical protein
VPWWIISCCRRTRPGNQLMLLGCCPKPLQPARTMLCLAFLGFLRL